MLQNHKKLHKKVKKEEIFFLVQNLTILLKTSPEYTQAGVYEKCML